MPHDIFISYSSKDKPTADALCATLERRGLRCWIAPRDILPGVDWSEAIIDAISGARALVLVYSEHANTSPQIRREVERAVHKGIAIIPLRIADVPMSKSLEYFISTPHWLDALTPPLQRHLDYLADTLERFVEPRPEPPEPAPIPGVSLHTSSTDAMPPGPPLTPAEAPANTRRSLVIGAAVVAAIVIAAAAYFAGGGNRTDGTGRTEAVSSTGVPRELVGAWVAQTTVNGLPITVETSLDDNGDARVTSTFRDEGRYGSSRGQWWMINTAGLRTAGTHRFLSESAMSMTGPLGTATWTREPRSGSGSSGGLAGTWTTTGKSPDGLPATTTLIFGPDGSYQLIARSQDSATLEAGGGRWRSLSNATGLATAGTYHLPAPDVLVWTAPTGTLNYRRR